MSPCDCGHSVSRHGEPGGARPCLDCPCPNLWISQRPVSGGRITPREVVFAFRKTGLEPRSGSWTGSRNGRDACGCALTALVALGGGVMPEHGIERRTRERVVG